MATASYRNVTFDEIEIGKPVSVSRPVTHTEVEAMALVSGDVDPYHVEAGALEHDEGPVSAQAVGAEAILSGLLNRRMPGPGTRILSQDLRFRGKIRTGDDGHRDRHGAREARRRGTSSSSTARSRRAGST